LQKKRPRRRDSKKIVKAEEGARLTLEMEGEIKPQEADEPTFSTA